MAHMPLQLADSVADSPVAGLYVHVPFCRHRCNYCDFYTITLDADRAGPFVDSLLSELRFWGDRLDLSACETVFIGGGTPTALPGEDLYRLVSAIASAVGPADEFTVEANPATVDLPMARRLRELGVDRLSFGAQSFDADELRRLDRIHGPAAIGESVGVARDAGFDNLNLDLMFGVPAHVGAGTRQTPLPLGEGGPGMPGPGEGQPSNAPGAGDGEPASIADSGHSPTRDIATQRTLTPALSQREREKSDFPALSQRERENGSPQTVAQWRANLAAAVALGVEHLSCYGLTYEPNTPLTQLLRAGRVQGVDDETSAQMYEATVADLSAGGFGHYEISNWARPGRACRHNLLYWHNRTWLGIGPSASSHLGGRRFKAAPHLGRYMRALAAGEPEWVDIEQLAGAASAGETAFLALRLREGLDLDELARRHGPSAEVLFADAIARHESLGLLDRVGRRIRLTEKALPIADSVLADFVQEDRD